MSTPFWAPPPEKYPGPLPEKADVLVIGGGIAGTSLLWHLARLRIDAVLVERRHVAWGASGRNAGFLLAGVASSYAEAVRTYGRGKAREVWELTNENHDRVVEAARGHEFGYRRLGSAVVPPGGGGGGAALGTGALRGGGGVDRGGGGTPPGNPGAGEGKPAR